ncbi:MAG: response regulator transcription factor [Eubacterium sp.]|nr:response regulator transcription factor [Eubacterium sp.]
MRVAICDDDQGCCSRLEGWLKMYRRAQKIRMEIHIFNTVELLLNQVAEGSWYDVVFLDIEFPEGSGVELGHFIRDNTKNEAVQIVYISGKTKYCRYLFALEPLNFHHKPLHREEIFADLDKVVRRSSDGKQVLRYKEDGILKWIALRDVMYVKSVDKMLEVMTKDNKRIRIRENLQDLGEKYADYSLCQCHRSHVVNLSYVVRYLDHCLFMENGAEIPVGRRYVEKVKKAWVDYDMEVK